LTEEGAEGVETITKGFAAFVNFVDHSALVNVKATSLAIALETRGTCRRKREQKKESEEQWVVSKKNREKYTRSAFEAAKRVDALGQRVAGVGDLNTSVVVRPGIGIIHAVAVGVHTAEEDKRRVVHSDSGRIRTGSKLGRVLQDWLPHATIGAEVQLERETKPRKAQRTGSRRGEKGKSLTSAV
jgi:hypothetical protein